MLLGHSEQLQLHHILSQVTEGADGWGGEVGWIDQEKVRRLCPAAADDTLIFVCGTPPMYEALCGARGEPGLAEGTVLQALGFADEHVFTF